MPPPSENHRIEQLCVMAQANNELAERELFLLLIDSFRIFAQHKVRDSAEVEDIVQDALAVVAQKYKETTFVSSFARWAHNILRNTLLGHYREKATHSRLHPDCVERVAQQNRRFAWVLNLRYQPFKPEEIANKLEIKTDYLYVSLARARFCWKPVWGYETAEQCE